MLEYIAKGILQQSEEWHKTDKEPFGCAFWALFYVVIFIAFGVYYIFFR